jgi:hypothetical protein
MRSSTNFIAISAIIMFCVLFVDVGVTAAGRQTEVVDGNKSLLKDGPDLHLSTPVIADKQIVMMGLRMGDRDGLNPVISKAPLHGLNYLNTSLIQDDEPGNFDNKKLALKTFVVFSPLESTQIGFFLKGMVGTSSADHRQPHNSAQGSGSDGSVPIVIGGIALEAEHQINDHWALMANLSWEKPQKEKYQDKGAAPDAVVPVVWDQSTGYILGVTFLPASRWAVRAKVSLDNPLMSNALNKADGGPDQSRLWIAAGVDYHIHEDFSFNLEFNRLTLGNAHPSMTNSSDTARSTSNPDSTTDIDVISALLKIQF